MLSFLVNRLSLQIRDEVRLDLPVIEDTRSWSRIPRVGWPSHSEINVEALNGT